MTTKVFTFNGLLLATAKLHYYMSLSSGGWACCPEAGR